MLEQFFENDVDISSIKKSTYQVLCIPNITRQSNLNQDSYVLVMENVIKELNISEMKENKMLDGLIQDCSPEAEQEQVAFELTELTRDNSNQLSPVVTNVNGFEMGVETEKNSGTLKRRRAVARNKQGIVMLKGEYSFSSIDQILIDELVFYIQTNDLKAD